MGSGAKRERGRKRFQELVPPTYFIFRLVRVWLWLFFFSFCGLVCSFVLFTPLPPPPPYAVDKTWNMEHSGTSRNIKKIKTF